MGGGEISRVRDVEAYRLWWEYLDGDAAPADIQNRQEGKNWRRFATCGGGEKDLGWGGGGGYLDGIPGLLKLGLVGFLDGQLCDECRHSTTVCRIVQLPNLIHDRQHQSVYPATTEYLCKKLFCACR